MQCAPRPSRAAHPLPTPDDQLYMVVGFEVQPCSIKRAAGKAVENLDCGIDVEKPPEAQEVAEGSKIVYT